MLHQQHQQPVKKLFFMRDIVAMVAVAHNLSPVQLREQDRKRACTKARRIAYYLCRTSGRQYADIGRFFGRDHGTILRGVNWIKHRLPLDPKLAEHVQAFENNIVKRETQW